MNLSTLTKQVGETLKRNSPVILTALAAAGTVTAVVTAIRATPHAVHVINERIEEMEADWQNGGPEPKVLNLIDRSKLVWRFYIPTGFVTVSTVACIIGAQSLNQRRQAALIGAYSMVEAAHREYKEKAEQYLTTAEQTKIHDQIAEQRMIADPAAKTNIIVMGKGENLCYDIHRGQYFRSDMETLRKAQNDVNLLVINDGYASLNDFYERAGETRSAQGEELGWTIDTSLELVMSTMLAENDEPAIAFTFAYLPVEKFWKVR